MTVVDASVFVAAIWTQDVNHHASRTWLRRHVQRRLSLEAPGLLIVEVAGAIARRTGNVGLGREAIRRIEGFPALQILKSEERLLVVAAELAADLRLRGADALYVALAEVLHVPLVTWDREQRDRGGQRVTVYRPDEQP